MWLESYKPFVLYYRGNILFEGFLYQTLTKHKHFFFIKISSEHGEQKNDDAFQLRDEWKCFFIKFHKELDANRNEVQQPPCECFWIINRKQQEKPLLGVLVAMGLTSCDCLQLISIS